jgi:hypothetical protein
MALSACRLGFHKWVRAKRRADSDEAFTVCRRCGREPGSGLVASLSLCGAVTLAAMILFWVGSPFLASVLMIGAVTGLGWTMLPAVFDRVAHWLSVRG